MIVCFLSSSCCLMIETHFIKLTRKHQSLLFILFSFFYQSFLHLSRIFSVRCMGFMCVFHFSGFLLYRHLCWGGFALKIQNKLKTKHEPCLLSNCFFTQFPFFDALLLKSLITSSFLYSVRLNLFKKYLSLQQGGFRLFTFFFKKKRLPHLLRLFALAHN